MFIFWGAFFQLGIHSVLKIVNTYTHNAIWMDKRKGKRLKCMCYIIRLSCWILYWRLSCMQPGNTAFSHILMSFSDAVSSHSLTHTVSCQITPKEMRNTHSLSIKTTSHTISTVRCLQFKWILSKVRRWKIAFEDDLTIIPSYSSLEPLQCEERNYKH